MMEINVEIHEIDSDDQFEDGANFKRPFKITVDPEWTVEDLKRKIEDEEDYDVSKQKVSYLCFSLENTDVIKECLKDGDTVTVSIQESGRLESTANVKNITDSEIFLITGSTTNFRSIPLQINSQPKKIHKGLFNGKFKFGVVENCKVDDDTVYEAYIYKVKDGAEIELLGCKDVWQKEGESKSQIQATEKKTFRKSEIRKGIANVQMIINMLSPVVRDVVAGAVKGAVAGTVEGATGT